MHRSIHVFVLLALHAVKGDDAIGLCCLCGGCKPPVRFNELVDAVGTTCGRLANQMADPSNDSKQGNGSCKNLQNLHFDRCCNPNFDPPPIAQAPTSSPGSKIDYGPYAPCNLCIDGSLPTNPNTMTAVAGIPGTPTCRDLYWITKKGHIEERMCRPLQNYFQGPCGCVISGGGGNNNGGGGAPDQFIPAPAPTSAVQPTPAAPPTPAASPSFSIPPKRTVPANNSKEDEKLFGGGTRGNLHKKRKLAPKGQTLRGTAN